MALLVTGGGGYIGSHCVKQLLAAGFRVVVVDNQSCPIFNRSPFNIPTYDLDLQQTQALQSVLEKEKITNVLHFAGASCIRESGENPLRYYQNNVVASVSLFQAMQAAGVKHLVFSSTCATYGNPAALPITEQTPQQPISPYGWSKLTVERLLQALVASAGWRVAIFRYFNAIGAASDGSLVEVHSHETRLVPRMIQAFLGQRGPLTIYGSDHATPDGTCIRDYIHVDDICAAHLKVIPWLQAQPEQAGLCMYNLGLNRPYSVKAILQAFEALVNQPVPVLWGARKTGEPSALYADCTKARQELGWHPHYTDLTSMLKTAWDAYS